MTGAVVPSPAAVAGDVILVGDASPIDVPSGQLVTLQDVIWNEVGPTGLTMRFRFVAPQIAKDAAAVDAETALADMQALCEGFALSRIADFGPKPGQIIISLSDKPIPFGESAPDVTQFFEAFTIQDGTCVWEMY